jgi:hypothetical protein
VGAVVVFVGVSRVRQGRDVVLSLWVYGGLLSEGVPDVQMVVRECESVR